MQLSNKNKIILVILSSLAGFVNGFLGGGGGVIVVALLLSVLKLNQQQSQATALLIILPLTVVSSIVYFFNGAVQWDATLFTTVGFVVGGIVGALLLNKINGTTLKILFSLVLIAGGIKMFF